MGGIVGGGKGGSSIDFDAMEYADKANKILDESLETSLPYIGDFMARGIDSLQEQSRNAAALTREFYERAQAESKPYREAGYEAFDTLQDTLGLSRPGIGSSAIAKEADIRAQEMASRSQLRNAAMQLAGNYKLNPQDQFSMVQGLTHGTNLPGQIAALQQMGRPPSRFEGLPEKARGFLESSTRSLSNPITSFLQNALPAHQQLKSAQYNTDPLARAALMNLGRSKRI